MATTAPALAQRAGGSVPSARIEELLVQDFEIKAVMASPTGPRLILQKGSSVYNCDGRRLGTDVPAAEPNPTVGVSRGLCFVVTFR